jgi:PIN domain nuclease of toxin-antitoxin system
MNLLLDSHIFVWWGEGGQQLTPRAWQAIASPANSVYVSLVTAWELAIKQSLGKMQIPEPFEALLEKGGFALLQIALDHTRFVATLPFHHRDPFDRCW